MIKRPWSCVVFAALLSAFFGMAVAGTPDGETPAEETVCDPLQGGTPSLYGLCVAFCEAHDCEPDFSLENPFENCKPSSRKILEKYRSRMQDGDPDMPCLVSAACPCFSADELASIPPQDVSGLYSQCDSMPPITNVIGSYSPANYAQIDESALLCIYVSADPPVIRTPTLTAEEAAACRDLIVAEIATSPYCP